MVCPPLPAAYRARWVLPVSSPPVPDGVIEVDADGRIRAIRSGRDAEAVDLGDVAIVPALVNAHVHLEFSDLAEPIAPALPFPKWVGNVVARRRTRTGAVSDVIRRGLDEVRRSGTVAVGEIATGDELAAYEGASVSVTAFRELIGPLAEGWSDLLEAAERHLRAATPTEVSVALSPHAPYTVPQELFERSVALAARHQVPVAVHLAETAAERDLLARGSGELVEMMRSLGLWRDELHPRGRRPLDWLQALSALPRAIVVHGNYLEEDELDFLSTHPHLTVVYCPRTHAYFGHRPHPFRALLESGASVALGTDGRSSNPDLDLWREGRFVRQRHPDLSSDTILDLVTRRGAEALGVSDRHGVLEVGRRADFLVVAVSPSGGGPDVFSPQSRVTRIFRGGTETDCHDGPSCHE